MIFAWFGLAMVAAAVAGGGVAMCAPRLRRDEMPVPKPTVRLHVLHEGADSGDMTVQGILIGERRDQNHELWLILDKARALHDDGTSTELPGLEVKASRIILLQNLVGVDLGPLVVA